MLKREEKLYFSLKKPFNKKNIEVISILYDIIKYIMIFLVDLSIISNVYIMINI